jgi:hypothetical protein
MQEKFYFLAPVKAVKVTSQNLQEVAEWCGGSVAQTESRRVPGRMDSYVWVPTPKDTKLSWAFPGMTITKRLVVTVKGEIRATYAIFRRDYFEKNYWESPQEAVEKTWEREAQERMDASMRGPKQVTVNVSVGDAMSDALEKVREEMEKIASEAGIENVTVNVSEEEQAPENPEGSGDNKPEVAFDDAITG